MRRSARARIVVAAAAALMASWVVAPLVLRRLEFFRLRQVELIGIRHLSPDAVIGALRLSPQASVFASVGLLRDRVRGLPGVADARVVRRYPAALRVIVREVEPTALVPGTEGFGVVDAAAHRLPFDPTRSGLDLPIATTADSGVAAVLALIQSVDPVLFREVEVARAVGRGGVALELGAGRVLLRRDASPQAVRALALVRQELAARRHAFAELDGRYEGQVVVRPPAGRGVRRG